MKNIPQRNLENTSPEKETQDIPSLWDSYTTSLDTFFQNVEFFRSMPNHTLENQLKIEKFFLETLEKDADKLSEMIHRLIVLKNKLLVSKVISTLSSKEKEILKNISELEKNGNKSFFRLLQKLAREKKLKKGGFPSSQKSKKVIPSVKITYKSQKKSS